MKLLIIDSTIRPKEISRTAQLLGTFLQRYLELHLDCETETVTLRDLALAPLLNEDITARDSLLNEHHFSHPMFTLARQFADADRIVLAAPFWDLSFPSILKLYIEHISVGGITFGYGEHGQEGYCHADKLTFLQTSGGLVGQENPAKSYLESVCKMFGISSFDYFCAEGLDVKEMDTEAIWETAAEMVQKMAE